MHALGPDRGRGRVGTNKCDQMLIDQGLGPCIEPTRTVVHSITPALRFNTHTRYIRLNNAIIMSMCMCYKMRLIVLMTFFLYILIQYKNLFNYPPR